MVVPLDEALAIPSGAATPSLAKRAMRLGTRMSFAELEEKLLAQHDVHLTDSTLDSVAQKTAALQRQTARRDLTRWPRSPAAWLASKR